MGYRGAAGGCYKGAGFEGARDSLPKTFQIAMNRCRILKGRVASANPNLSICVPFARGMVDAPHPGEMKWAGNPPRSEALVESSVAGPAFR